MHYLRHPQVQRGSATRRRRFVVVSVLSALALHAFAIGGAARVMVRWHTPAVASTDDLRVTAMFIQPARPVDTSNSGRGAVTPLQEAEAPTPSTSQAPPPPRVVPRTTAPVTVTSSDPVSTAHFYRLGEVDRPAAPMDDWNLDASALDTAGLERIVADVFINDAGAIVACKVIEPTNLDPQVSHLLEQRLTSTDMLPALRGEITVASVRTIEFSVLPALESLGKAR